MIGLAAAQAWVDSTLHPIGAEMVPLAQAAGRVLAADLPALPPPDCARAAVDGFAVLAAATEGASDYAPLPVATIPVAAGAKLPAGMDAVLPPHVFEDGAALAAVAAGDGVMDTDGLTMAAGMRLQPGQLAALALRGLAAIAVTRQPCVALHVAGPKSGEDALTPMLAALIAATGGIGDGRPDLVLHAGRSGPGHDDRGIASFETVFAHGVRMNPGETSALGFVAGTPAILLPGGPLACMVGFALLAARALRRLGGVAEPEPVYAVLTRKIVSRLGQTEAVRVRVVGGEATPCGPSLAAAADGLVLVPEGSEGCDTGERVAIFALP